LNTKNALRRSTFPCGDAGSLKKKMLNWLRPFNIFCFLDSCGYTMPPHRYDCLVAVGATNLVQEIPFTDLDAFVHKRPGWKFGHLSYELKEELHAVRKAVSDPAGFPRWSFFEPEVVLELNGNVLAITAREPETVWQNIQASPEDFPATPSVALKEKVGKEAYLETIRSLQEHIGRGDCYEINYCIEFFNNQCTADPFSLYQQLSAVSPNPFSAFYRNNDSYLLCASPERFLVKQGRRLISQPIKGTIKRNLQDAVQDEQLREQLRHSTKDQSENVMVVDLVRNDLSRVCEEGSVRVDELFGVHAFPQVHQMISTVSGTLAEGVSFSKIIQALFPMGSMTGAPKYKVMQLIDQYESGARGIFSGSVGYINPDGDFDFNVVIRSLMYNAATSFLSCQVGSGITFYSDAEKEWEECMLKAAAIRKVLEG
jgi:para-aminobenzoate synthetase component I